MNVKDVFQMPRTANPRAIAGRTSTITAAFVSSILPVVEPTDDEIIQALQILGMDPSNVRCAYCGNKATEWDHFRPIVIDEMPTGYISEIRNLVPACAKCNQSKSGSHWREWMLGTAKHSPKSRGIPDLSDRVARLEAYEQWGATRAIDFTKLVPPDLWAQHWANLKHLHEDMRAFQVTAITIRNAIDENRLQQSGGAR